MPSPLIDIPAVGQAIRTSGQSSSVKKWIKGYAKSKGACVEATIGAYVNATMKVTARATTEKNLETIGSTITSQLNASFVSEFNRQFNAGSSMSVAFHWLGISKDGSTYESVHQKEFKDGKRSVEVARKNFTAAVKKQSGNEVSITASAYIEGVTPTPALVCLYFAVEKVVFEDGTSVVTVNGNPNSLKTGTAGGREVGTMKDGTMTITKLN